MNTDRPMPADLNIERTVLGTLIRDNAHYGNERELTVDHFSTEHHRRIFRAIAELLDVDRKPADELSIREKLDSRKQLESVGGFSYILGLSDGVVSRKSIRHFVDILTAKLQSRMIIQASALAIERAFEHDAAEKIVSDMQDQMVKIVSSNPATEADIFIPSNEFVNQANKEISWRVSRVIEVGTNGFIFARPKAGKSYVTTYMACCLATGERWLEFDTKQCRVALVNREDYAGTTARRIRRILQGMTMDPSNAAVGEYLWVNSRAQSQRLMLDNPRELSTLVKNLQKRKIEFLILDVLNVLHDKDENDNTEMRNLMKRIEQIRDDVGCEICIVHHSKKNVDEDTSVTDSGRGASAIAGFAEYIINLGIVDETAHVRRMRFESKAAEAHWPVYWQIRDLETSGGVAIERTDYTPPSKNNSRSRVGKALNK